MKIIDTRKQNIQAELDRIRKAYFSTRLVRKVEKIIDRIRKDGDTALLEYTKQFDKIELSKSEIFIEQSKLYSIAENLSHRCREAIDLSADRIFDFHNSLKLHSSAIVTKDDSFLAQYVRPLKRIGVYVPGGTAPLVSSVLMNAIPALCAGVKEIYIATPPDKMGQLNPAIAYAATKVNAVGVYLIGGAQAIAALAFGTDIVKKVDKVVGPGNIYVTLAKKLVYGFVDIDMIAGPSEILVLTDGSVRADYVASDLLSQLEHDQLATAFLVTDNFLFLKEVEKQVLKQMKSLSRKDILKKSIKNCYLIHVKDMMEGIKISNIIAPEHLEIMAENESELAKGIENAGAVFLGKYSVEAIGDYVAGPNHTLPTSGTAVYFSPLNTHDFYKKMSIISISAAEFDKIKGAALTMAEMEGLDAHFKSIDIRVS